MAVSNVAVYDNASLDVFTLTNYKSTALNHKTFVFHDKDNVGGMCLGNDSGAGAIAGVVESQGIDTTYGVPVNNIPQNQTATIRFRGITKVRAGAVAITAGEPVYAVGSTGKVTNSSSSNTLVGTALTSTDGTADQLVVVRLSL